MDMSETTTPAGVVVIKQTIDVHDRDSGNDGDLVKLKGQQIARSGHPCVWVFDVTGHYQGGKIVLRADGATWWGWPPKAISSATWHAARTFLDLGPGVDGGMYYLSDKLQRNEPMDGSERAWAAERTWDLPGWTTTHEAFQANVTEAADMMPLIAMSLARDLWPFADVQRDMINNRLDLGLPIADAFKGLQ